MKCKPWIRHFSPPKFQCFSSQFALHGLRALEWSMQTTEWCNYDKHGVFRSLALRAAQVSQEHLQVTRALWAQAAQPQMSRQIWACTHAIGVNVAGTSPKGQRSVNRGFPLNSGLRFSGCRHLVDPAVRDPVRQDNNKIWTLGSFVPSLCVVDKEYPYIYIYIYMLWGYYLVQVWGFLEVIIWSKLGFWKLLSGPSLCF